MFTNYSKDIHSVNLPIESEKLSDEYFSVIIEPAGTWVNPNWVELWEHRELFYFLTLRDIKIRYKQTLLGITWVLLQPAISTLVFSILFTNLGQNSPLNVPYPVFAFSGFTVWIFIAVAISSSSSSLISNPNLVTKVYFPRLILPLSAVAANLLDLLLGLISLMVVMAIYGVAISRTIIFAPLFLILGFIIATSIGILLSAINVRFRDVKYILPVVLQLWLFVTPIFYSLDMIPEKTRWIWKLNPMTGALGGFRAALFGASFDSFEIAVSVVAAVILAALALQIFYRMEDGFADVI
jgi:lipopolysaccharide transport system permease protein